MSDNVFTQPDSTPLLNQTKFQLSFTRLPSLQYFCQQVKLPDASLTVLEQPTPFKNKPVAGNKISYDSFDITFLLEETLKSWNEIHIWMKDLGIETGFKDYNNLKNLNKVIPLPFKGGKPDVYSDATLSVLSSQNNPKIRFMIYDAFPYHLSGIKFDTTSTPQTIMTATASFAIFYYEMVPIPQL